MRSSATYTTRLSSTARPQHLPLGRALSEYAGALNKPKLLSLLLPVQRAAEQAPWLRRMIDSNEIYYPLRWTAAEALQLLTDMPRLEAAGVIVRVPSAWRGKRPPRPQVTATVGAGPPSQLGAEGLLDFRIEVTLDGETLSAGRSSSSWRRTACTSCAAAGWSSIAISSATSWTSSVPSSGSRPIAGLTFAEAMRLVAGADDHG